MVSPCCQFDARIPISNEGCDPNKGVELKSHGAHAHDIRTKIIQHLLYRFANAGFEKDKIQHLDLMTLGQVTCKGYNGQIG